MMMRFTKTHGGHREMAKQVTLSDIAHESNVSLSTVSLVLREKPGIPPETRERVLNAARALGYQPKNSSGLNTEPQPARKLRTISLIVKLDSELGPQAN